MISKIPDTCKTHVNIDNNVWAAFLKELINCTVTDRKPNPAHRRAVGPKHLLLYPVKNPSRLKVSLREEDIPCMNSLPAHCGFSGLSLECL